MADKGNNSNDDGENRKDSVDDESKRNTRKKRNTYIAKGTLGSHNNDSSDDAPNPRSILVTRTNDDDVSQTSKEENEIEIHYSSDTGIYKFFKTRGKNVNQPNVTKAEAFIYMTIPPDGGYAWVILAMAFLCQVIVDGILFSIGVILPHIAKELSMSSKQTALVSSTQIGTLCLEYDIFNSIKGIYYISAPLGSVFINKFGFRPVAIVGAFVASVAVLMASFSQGIWMLVLFNGILAGSAMGMFWMSTSLITNYYFERYRAMAVGLASSGSGVGLILISLLNINIVDKIGWRHTTQLHMVLLVIAGFLSFTYREVEPTKVGHVVELLSDADSDESLNSIELASLRYSTYITPSPSVMRSVTSVVTNAKIIEQRLTPLSHSQFESTKRSFIDRICPCCAPPEKPLPISDSKRFIVLHDPLDRDDIFYDGNPDYSRAGTIDMEDIEVLPGKESKARTINYTLSVIRPATQTVPEKKHWIPLKIKSAFVSLFDLSLLKVAEFRLLLLESFLFPMGFNIPLLYGTLRAEIRKDYASLIPVIIGVTGISFRIIIGFIACKIQFHTAYLAGTGMIIGGMVTLLSGFMGQSSVLFQFIFAVCFGIGTASYGALRSTVYVKVVGLERLTNAFGLTTLMMGMGTFIGTSTAGIMNDYFDGYWVTFVFSGTCMTIAGCLKMCMPEYVKYRRALDVKKPQKKVRFATAITRSKWWRKCCCFCK